MKLSFPRRLVAMLSAAMIANSVASAGAIQPALAGSSPFETGKTQVHSDSCVLHAGCGIGLNCLRTEFSAVGLPPQALGQAARRPPFGPAFQGGVVAASAGRGLCIRAPPRPSRRS